MRVEEIEEVLAEMIGKNTVSNGFEPDLTFLRLAKCVKYLMTQFLLSNDDKEYKEKVIDSAWHMLAENRIE